MKSVRHIPFGIALASLLGILLPFTLFARDTDTPSHFVGEYRSAPVPGNKPSPSMSLSLGPDGTATVTQDPGSSSGNSETTSFGHWKVSGDGIVITFDPADGKPVQPAMTFQSSEHGLKAVTWNHSVWGKITPPIAKKDSGQWHARRHWWSPQ